jgi:hypothetical protein
MPTLLIAAALCMVVSLLVAIMVWMTVVRLRDRRDASEVVPLEVAVCIRKNNGDIVIRQRRGISILGLVLGLLMALGGLAFPVVWAVNSVPLAPEAIGVPFGLLVLGGLVAWVSARGFREPHVFIEAASQTIEIRRGGLRGKQTWSFDAIAGVTRQRRLGESFLPSIAEVAIAPRYAAGSITDRMVIGLQHADSHNMRICTATKQAARRVPEMIATAIGKPVLTK